MCVPQGDTSGDILWRGDFSIENAHKVSRHKYGFKYEGSNNEQDCPPAQLPSGYTLTRGSKITGGGGWRRRGLGVAGSSPLGEPRSDDSHISRTEHAQAAAHASERLDIVYMMYIQLECTGT